MNRRFAPPSRGASIDARRHAVLVVALSACGAEARTTAPPPSPDVPGDVSLDARPDVTQPRDAADDLAAVSDVAVAPDIAASPDAAAPPDVAPDACVPTVARGGEATDALCADGRDNDCDGYVDCRDFNCSRSASVSVCRRDGGAVDAPAPDAPALDAPAPGVVGASGGSVELLRFAAFGDVRPPVENDTSRYPAAIFGAVMDGVASLGAQFAVASGDYMFASTWNAAGVSAQVDMLLAAERRFGGHVFHAMGNHECTGASNSNCPAGSETANVRAFRARLAPAYPAPYYDFVVQTSRGDAHFVVTAPNAWSPAQSDWLTRALARPALYTVVVAHEPPGQREAPGSMPIEDAIRARPGGVTLRLYGHNHLYAHPQVNAIVTGNAGAPLASASGSYGFAIVEQRADGDLVVTAYDVGSPPMVADSFVLTPAGARAR